MVSPRILGNSKSTLKRIAYTESYAKLKKFVPAPGFYKEVDKGFHMTSRHTFEAEKLFLTENKNK